jgi:hypothetical protein
MTHFRAVPDYFPIFLGEVEQFCTLNFTILQVLGFLRGFPRASCRSLSELVVISFGPSGYIF